MRRRERTQQEMMELELYRRCYTGSDGEDLATLQLAELGVFDYIRDTEDMIRHNQGVNLLEHLGLLDAFRDRETLRQLVRCWMRIKTDLHFKWEAENAVSQQEAALVSEEE